MKHFFSLLLFATLSQTNYAQSAIAKIKYELAEEAFNKNDFVTTIAELEGAENLLGTTNPKILYLRIQAQSRLIEMNPMADFSIIESARKNCSYYLKQYETNAGIEDKFKDVYLISEQLKKYPVTSEEFEKQKREIVLKQRADAQAAQDNKQKDIITTNTYKISNNKKDHEAYYSRGVAKMWLKDYAGAIEDFNKAIEYSKKTAVYYAERGSSKSWLKDRSGSLEDYNMAIALDPKSDRYYGLRSNLRYVLKDDKGAIEDADQVVALKPDSSSYDRRGNLKRLIGDYAGAIADYTKTIELTGRSNANYFMGRSLCFIQNKEYAAAVEDVSKAIQLRPQVKGYYYTRGKYLQLYLKDSKSAAADFNKLIGDPASNTMAMSHYFLGNKAKAIQIFDQLISTRPEDASFYYYSKAGLYCFEKDKENALANLRTALEKGYTPVRPITADENLAFIRELPEFKSLIDQYLK